MNTIEQVTDFSLKHFGKGNERILELLFQEYGEEAENLLEAASLFSFEKRSNFYWKLQTLHEKIVFENPLADEEMLISLLNKEWNNLNEPQKLTIELCSCFLSRSILKDRDARNAFFYICNGDLEGSKQFNSKQRIFTELLIRYFVCLLEEENDLNVLSLVDEVISWDYTAEEAEPAQQFLLGIGFRFKKGINDRMAAYKRLINIDELCFVNGLQKIITNSSKHHKTSDSMRSLIGSFYNHSSIAEKTFVTEGELDMESNDMQPIEKMMSIINSSDNSMHLVGATTEETVEGELNRALQSIQRAIGKMQSEGQLLVKHLEEENNNKLRIAEEEIKRLNIALDQEKERVRQTEDKVLTNLLKSLGGIKGNYLLSDLFEESQGIKPNNPNISTSRLVNLFSNLSLAIELEEFSNNKEMDEIFIVTRAELIKNYETNGPISTDSDEIKVKLLKYGWMLNNRVIIPPLVTEIKISNREDK
ncbi:hypothetical protein [Paenibacillus odorifer]|uniref:hypothetical protein n=1 Tax=Paenibacillus odorifer TaxID=189426 RepID=UPI00096E79BF|nr:hypothetical protein [Paenibacillus odorifer]OME19923.1 hypothetical protein BSK57_23430 [Paenibacillus odorifer]